MASTATLAIQIISDATKAAKGFQDTSTQASKMGQALSKASRVAQVGLLALGAAALSSAKAAAEDAAGQAKLAGALRRNADATKPAIAAAEAWIASLSRATGVADDELRPAMATLVRSTGSVAQSQTALKTAMDISAATGKPLQTVSAALAKGYAGQTASIGKLVPGMDAATLASGDMSKIMAELNVKVGGEAADAAKTAQGQYQVLTNNFNEAKESLGTGFLPILSEVAVALADVGVWVQDNTGKVKALAAIFTIAAAGTIAANTALKIYRGTLIALRAAAIVMRNAQLALNLAMIANPVGLIVAAVVLLIAGLVLAYKKSETFRTAVQAVGKAGQAAIGWVVDKVKDLWNWVQKLIDKIKNIKWPAAPKWVTAAGSALGELLGSYRDYGSMYSGGASYGMAPAVFTAPGELKASGAESMFSRIGGRGGAAVVQINVTGALDPDAVARQIEGILAGRGRRLGRYTR